MSFFLLGKSGISPHYRGYIVTDKTCTVSDPCLVFLLMEYVLHNCKRCDKTQKFLVLLED